MSPPDWVPDVVEDAASTVGEAASGGWSAASDAAGDVRDGAAALAGEVRDGAHAAVDTARDLADGAVDLARDAAGTVLDGTIAVLGPKLRGAGVVLDELAMGFDRLTSFVTKERLPLDVPPWMVRGSGPLPDVGDGLRSAARELGQVETALVSLLADTAVVLGWEGDAAQAASARQARHGTQLDTAAQALLAAADAVEVLGERLAADGPPLEDLLDRYDQLRREAAVEALRPSLLLLTVPRIDTGETAAERAQRIADDEVPPLVRRLREADTMASERLAKAVAALQEVGAEAAGDGWVGDVATPSILAVLSRHSVVESPADRALVDWAATLGDDAAAAAALRERLAELPPAQVADLLGRHPGLARRLRGGLPEHPAPGSPERALADAMATSTGHQDRSRAVAAAMAAMGPDARRRLALLYPEVVGRLDGAPMADRVAANRVQISAALLDAQEETASLARARRERGDARQGLDELLDKAEMVLEDDDAAAALERNTDRIAYYEKLLHEELPPAAVRRGGPAEVGHQIIYFDPSGDGTIAEVWGPLDEKTTHVGLFVPGTTADMENFEGYSDKARLFALEDNTGGTTMVAWLGSDMPDAVVANAPNAHYAEAGGKRLRDFTEGLHLPEQVDVTAVGHSYGGAVVGVADRTGLPVDRVFHVESAGAGAGVDDVGDYAPGRDVERYTMQAPGDPISHSQGRYLGGVGHGADVNEMDGFTRLDTGRFADDGPGGAPPGEMVTGHSDPLEPGTTAWNSLSAGIRGTEVTPYAPPTPDAEHPYEDLAYSGPAKVPVP